MKATNDQMLGPFADKDIHNVLHGVDPRATSTDELIKAEGHDPQIVLRCLRQDIRLAYTIRWTQTKYTTCEKI